MNHEMQHDDSPTWCIHCGTFDIYADSVPCNRTNPAQYDSRIPENRNRMFSETFGNAGVGGSQPMSAIPPISTSTPVGTAAKSSASSRGESGAGTLPCGLCGCTMCPPHTGYLCRSCGNTTSVGESGAGTLPDRIAQWLKDHHWNGLTAQQAYEIANLVCSERQAARKQCAEIARMMGLPEAVAADDFERGWEGASRRIAAAIERLEDE